MKSILLAMVLFGYAAQADCPDYYNCILAQESTYSRSSPSLQDLADRVKVERDRRRILEEQQRQTDELRAIREELRRSRWERQR